MASAVAPPVPLPLGDAAREMSRLLAEVPSVATALPPRKGGGKPKADAAAVEAGREKLRAAAAAALQLVGRASATEAAPPCPAAGAARAGVVVAPGGDRDAVPAGDAGAADAEAVSTALGRWLRAWHAVRTGAPGRTTRQTARALHDVVMGLAAAALRDGHGAAALGRPLESAIDCDCVPLAQALLDGGVPLPSTGLCWASSIPMVDLLASRGGDVNDGTGSKLPAGGWAERYIQSPSGSRMLLRRGLDVNAPLACVRAGPPAPVWLRLTEVAVRTAPFLVTVDRDIPLVARSGRDGQLAAHAQMLRSLRVYAPTVRAHADSWDGRVECTCSAAHWTVRVHEHADQTPTLLRGNVAALCAAAAAVEAERAGAGGVGRDLAAGLALHVACVRLARALRRDVLWAAAWTRRRHALLASGVAPA